MLASTQPQQRLAQFGNRWNVVQTTAGGSNTTPTRQHRELGQAHRARMKCQSMQRVTASQAAPLRKHIDHELICFYSSRRDQESCEQSGAVTQHTHFKAHHMFFSCTTHQSCFQNLLLRCQFSQHCCEEVAYSLGWKQAYPRCAEKHIYFRCFIHFVDTDGTVTLTTLPSTSTSPLLPRS